MANIKAGITLFSLGTAYLKGELDLEGVIRTAAEMGAEGYEIVASQMIPSYPYVSDEFVEFINAMCLMNLWNSSMRWRRSTASVLYATPHSATGEC